MSNHFVAAICQIAINLMVHNKLNISNPQVFECLRNNLNPNNPQALFINELVNYIQSSVGHLSPNGVNPNVIAPYVANWLQQKAHAVAATFPPPVQPQMYGVQPGMGVYNQGATWQTPGMAAQAITGGNSFSYDDPHNVSSNVPVTTMTTMPAVPMVINTEKERIQFNMQPSSNVGFTELKDDSVTVGRGVQGERQRHKYVIWPFVNLRSENTAEEAYANTYNTLSPEYVRGSWIHIVDYRELLHIPMAYNDYAKISAVIYSIASKNGWREALKQIGKDCAKSDWQIISNVFCKLFNAMSKNRIRIAGKLLTLTIDTMDDLDELANPSTELVSVASDIVKNMKYDETLDDIIDKCLGYMFDPANAIERNDPNFGDFIQCSGVRIYMGGKTEYDLAAIEEPIDRKAMIDALYAANTVLRIPKVAIATNVIDDDVLKIIRQNKVLHISDVNTDGTALMREIGMDFIDRAEYIFSVRKGDTIAFERFKIGTTLDNEIVIFL